MHRLRRLIVTLELEPGATVTETYLSELLECSRTPVREALQRLAAEQLVEIAPRRVIRIAEMNVSDLPMLMEAMERAVSSTASLAASRVTNRQLDELTRILTEAESADSSKDFVTVLELDFRFHNAMTEATGNRYLVSAFAPIHRLATRFGYAAFSRAETARISLEEHREIVEALAARKPDVVETLAVAHVIAARDRIQAEL